MNGKKIFTELLRMVCLLAAVSLVAFLLITNAPIDPLVSYVGTNSTLSPEAKEEIAEYWGLKESLPKRFLTWAGHALQGDLGTSITYKKPVAQVIGERFSYSFVLMLAAWILSSFLGFFLGIVCGLYQEGIFDRCIKVFCLILKSAPTFWIGLLLLSLFAVKLGWFPIGMAAPIGKLSSEVALGDRIYHLILPVLTLTLVSISETTLYTRQKLVEILSSDFILYARARGENRRQLVFRHILKNVALPAITVQFSSFSELFGGMALAENVFAYPGIGTAITAAALNGDVPLLLGIAVFSGLFVFSGNLIANILYGVLDPRIREGEAL
ncbi:MAG: ABC transporter permease [Lachnospiraceae bacterium]|nr:ABC transporter permease [Lachnospiraceae bacterium]